MATKLLKYMLLAVTHPNELRSLVNYGVWREPQKIEEMPESGYDRPAMRRCWEFLPLTSRSFAAVIKELEGELTRVICLFYLVLRGLDTIEDDMTLDLDLKCRLLEDFYLRLSEPGWTFNGSGPNESDRQLLVEFDVVIAELMMLEDRYKSVITRMCRHMGAGMAHYAREGAKANDAYAVATMADFDLYCHYVAGVVGEGLSALFSASGKEREDLGRMLTLSNSMGLMLQKTNIMRDFHEDLEDGRFFWPKELWQKYTNDPKEFYQRNDPEIQQKALHALSEMVLDALSHAPDCLDYLSLLKNQSIFSFCAIPQIMAIATLELCFMNPLVFKQNVKIRKSLAVHLITRATNPREVAHIFTTYARRIHAKVKPSDPNFVKICVAVGQIEQWEENRYPSWIFGDAGGLRGALPQTRDEPAAQSVTDARIRQLPSRAEVRAVAPRNGHVDLPPQDAGNGKMSGEDFRIMIAFIGGIVVFILLVMGGIFGAIYYVATHPGNFVERGFQHVEPSLNAFFNRVSDVVTGLVGSSTQKRTEL